MKKSKSDRAFDTVNVIIMIVILFIMIYPIYFTVIASFSEPREVVEGNVFLWIKGFTLDGYINVFKSDRIWTGYGNTIIYTILGTCFNLILTIPTAYVLSKKRMYGRTFLSMYFAFTMYFGGGLIPTYLLVKDLGLVNKPITLIILGGISIYNMIVARTFYQTSIPEEIYEAAEVDGCSEFGKFFRIALPLSAPIIAVMALYYSVGHWNDYFTALVYVTKSDYHPLQLVLRSILIENQTMLKSLEMSGQAVYDQIEYLTRMAYMAEAMKYAVIFIASLPLLVAYPFVQKHFVKGVMIGAIKG